MLKRMRIQSKKTRFKEMMLEGEEKFIHLTYSLNASEHGQTHLMIIN